MYQIPMLPARRCCWPGWWWFSISLFFPSFATRSCDCGTLSDRIYKYYICGWNGASFYFPSTNSTARERTKLMARGRREQQLHLPQQFAALFPSMSSKNPLPRVVEFSNESNPCCWWIEEKEWKHGALFLLSRPAVRILPTPVVIVISRLTPTTHSVTVRTADSFSVCRQRHTTVIYYYWTSTVARTTVHHARTTVKASPVSFAVGHQRQGPLDGQR